MSIQADPCECKPTLVSSGLVEGQSWPECVEGTPTVEVVTPIDPGQCKSGEDCPGPATPCSARVETNIDHACIALTMKQQKRADGVTEWDDLGVEVLVPSGAWGFWIKPTCGQERRAQICYGATPIWEAVVRCGECDAAE